jgi:hypothetical protein
MQDDVPQYACAPKHPAEATRSGMAYFMAVNEDYALFHLLLDTVLAGDHIGFATRELLDGVPEKEIPSPSELAGKSPGPRLLFLRGRRKLYLEMFVARLVDGFQTYVVDLIRAVLRARPEMLTSRQPTVSLEDILRHKTIEDLVQSVIERRVGALSYEGFAALQTWCAVLGGRPRRTSGPCLRLAHGRSGPRRDRSPHRRRRVPWHRGRGGVALRGVNAPEGALHL